MEAEAEEAAADSKAVVSTTASTTQEKTLHFCGLGLYGSIIATIKKTFLLV